MLPGADDVEGNDALVHGGNCHGEEVDVGSDRAAVAVEHLLQDKVLSNFLPLQL